MKSSRDHTANRCLVCGAPGDSHHIIHKDQGGLEYPLNRICLCERHHRGLSGPHRNADVDLKYKKALQELLMNLFPENHYREEEIRNLAQLSKSLTRTLVKNLKIYKEGYRKDDIVDFLMSGHLILDDEDF